MRICIIDKRRDTILPIVQELIQSLSVAHTVRVLNVQNMPPDQEFLEVKDFEADLYLLKALEAESLAFARYVEQQGTRVINSWAATQASQDRIVMAQLMENAGLPWPRTWDFQTLGALLADEAQLAQLSFPLLVKSRYNAETELIASVMTREELQGLAGTWEQEPVIVQEWVVGDGWDNKIWVIGEEVFAAKRRSPLEKRAKDQFQLSAQQIDAEMRRMALEAGRAFGLEIYGVDFLLTKQGPVAIDVNAFPGLRNLVGPDKALVRYIEQVPTRSAITADAL